MMEYGIRCGGCGQVVPEGIGHTCTREPPYSETSTKFIIKRYPITCPTCAAMKGRMTGTNITTAILDAGVVIWRSDAESIARAIIAYLEAP